MRKVKHRTASLHTDLHEEVGWRKDPNTDGKKGPTFHLAPLVPVLHQLLADLTINFIPAAEGKHEKKQPSATDRIIQDIQELFLMPYVFS